MEWKVGMEDQTKYTKWLAREAQLSQKHEEILAKREMLLAANKLLVGTQQKKLQVTTDDFHRTKTRNDQLVKELDALQTGLEKKACVSSNDAKFIGLQVVGDLCIRRHKEELEACKCKINESYWNMVEQEFPRWIARNKDSSKTQ